MRAGIVYDVVHRLGMRPASRTEQEVLRAT
jgi:hypothetical protein